MRSPRLDHGEEPATVRTQLWREQLRRGIRGVRLGRKAVDPKRSRLRHGFMTFALVLLLCGLWPVYLFHSWFSEVLPSNFIGAALVALGAIVGATVLIERTNVSLCVETSAFLLVPGGMGLLALLTSLPLDRLGVIRLSFFFLVAVPCFYAALICSEEQLHAWLIVAALPLACIVLITGDPPGSMNAIASGWVLMLAAILCVPESRREWSSGRSVLAGLYVVTIVTLGKEGPLIALLAAFLAVLLIGEDRASRLARRVTARPLPLVAGAALGWVLLVLALSQLEPQLSDNHDTLAARTDSLVAVMDERPLLGRGVSAFSESEVGEFYGERYPLNYLAEAFYSVGVPGLALMIVLTVMALRSAIQGGKVVSAAYVGLVVAALFSSGLYENYLLWFALGAMLRRPAGVSGGHARNHASSRALATAA